ncbi:MAG: hypothetical protein Q9168_006839 [Polycauliona sp. 1 TL-2023]
MPALDSSTWMVISPDGKTTIPLEQAGYSEQQQMLSIIPLDDMHISDDHGKRRLDTTTIEDIEKASQMTLKTLFEAWVQLRSITSCYKSSIEKRWRKKTVDQRKALLANMCPGMPSMHRPDFVALRKDFRSKELPFSLDIALRLPCINLEDLSRPDTLLLFFESRSNNFPALFTNADQNQLGVGMKSKMLVPGYVRGYTMYMNGEQTREGYGRIVSWEKDRQAFFKCYTCIAPEPGLGLMTLGVQRDILQFLVRCSKAIMHDMAMTDLVGTPTKSIPGAWNPQVLHEPAGRPIPKTASIDSLKVYMLEAPYRVPDMFNFTRLRSLVQAKCCEVRDHLHSIREDPGYFAEVIEEKHNIKPGEVLPLAFAKALSLLVLWLERTLRQQIDHMSRCIGGNLRSEKELKSQKGGYLSWLLWKVINYGDGNICSIRMFLQEIEINRPRISAEKKHFMPDMDRQVSELSLIAEMQRELNLSSCNEYFLPAVSKDELSASFNPLLDTSQVVIQVLNENKFELSSVVKDLRVFDYPSDKPRTAANTAKLRSAEQALDHFWEQVDSYFILHTGKSLIELDQISVLHRPLERTPPWEVFNTSINQELLVSKGQSDSDAKLALATLEELTERTVEKGHALEIRQKVKTRNPAILKEETAEECPALVLEDIDVSNTISSVPKVPLKKKAYKAAFPTFAKIFGKPITNALTGKPVEELSGKIPWHSFLTAMSRAGFAAEKLQGSRWLFSSSSNSGNGNKSIMFHEPHPENDLTTHLARRFARRLKGNFGWTAESFVLDDSPVEAGTIGVTT